MNIAWAVPRNKRTNPIGAGVRSLLIVVTAGVAVVATTTVFIFAGTVGAESGVLSSPAAIVATLAAVVVNTVIFDVVFRVATAARLGLLDVLPGAVLAAVLWQRCRSSAPPTPTTWYGLDPDVRTRSPSSSASWRGRSWSPSAWCSASS